MDLHGNRNFKMRGRDGRNYIVNIDIRVDGSADFTIKDIESRLCTTRRKL